MTLLHAAETALSTPSSSLKIFMSAAVAAAPSSSAAAKARSTAAHAARAAWVRAETSSSSLRAEFSVGLGEGGSKKSSRRKRRFCAVHLGKRRD